MDNRWHYQYSYLKKETHMYKNIFSLFIAFLSLSSIKIYAMDVDSLRAKLQDAAKSNDVATIQKLMPDGDLINSTNQHGETPLWVAGCFGHLEAMLEILKNPYCHDVDRPGANTPAQRRALHFACRIKTEKKALQVEVVQALLNKKADLEALSAHYESPICLAVRSSKNPALVAFLVDAGAKVERSQCKEGHTKSPLDEAIYEIYPEYIPLLLKSPRLTSTTLNQAIDFCKGYIQNQNRLDMSGPMGRVMAQSEIDEKKKKREQILALLLEKKKSFWQP
jgi:ankyrin repeat protein